jgi:hypothetical protein
MEIIEGTFLFKNPFIDRFAETLRKLESTKEEFDHLNFEFFNTTLNREFLGFLGVFTHYSNVVICVFCYIILFI